MIDYGEFQYAASPWTGVRWFTDLANQVGFDKVVRHTAFHPFVGPAKVIRVTTVTHPMKWLHQIYSWIHYHPPNEDIYISKLGEWLDLNRLSFTAFVNDYLSRPELKIDDFYKQYKADTVLRFEDMPWCAFEFFEALGKTIPSMESIDTSQVDYSYCIPTEVEIRQRVRRKESELHERYEYY